MVGAAHNGLGNHSRRTWAPRPEGEAGCHAHRLGRHKGLVSHLKEMDAAEHLDEADAVERPFLNGKVEFLNPMLICARHGEMPAAGRTG